MKVNSYKMELLENGNAKLTAFKGVNAIDICEIKNVEGLTADQVTERALVELRSRGIEVEKDMSEEYMVDQKIDLALVRVSLREALKLMRDKDMPINQKKEMLPIVQQVCSSCQIMVNTCKLELAIDVFQKGKK